MPPLLEVGCGLVGLPINLAAFLSQSGVDVCMKCVYDVCAGVYLI